MLLLSYCALVFHTRWALRPPSPSHRRGDGGSWRMGDFQGPVNQGKVTPGSRPVQSRCSSSLGTAGVLGRAAAGGSLSCTL